MNSKSITFLFGYLILLSFILIEPAIAWQCSQPPPPGCYKCQDGVWVPYGDCWSGCPACNSCQSCWCTWLCGTGTCCNGSCCSGTCCNGSCCQTGQTCCNGTCCGAGQTCCDGLTCYDPKKQQCCGYGNGKLCDVNETCCNDNCCDPSEHCENGQCVCNTCWTTKLEPMEVILCPACSFTGCGGNTEVVWERYVWVPAGPGEGGWCKNPTKKQVIGFQFECTEDWDATKVLECIAHSVICHYICDIDRGYFCVTCLVLEGLDCASGGLCNFVEGCIGDQETALPVEGDVVDYGGDMGKSCFIYSQ